MDRPTTQQIRFYLRLHYPVQVVLAEDGFRGCYPDLPGCGCAEADLGRLYSTLERERRQWITAQVLEGQQVPLPNSHAPSNLDAAAA